MKKIMACLCILALFNCKDNPEPIKDYVTFSGRIENQFSDSLIVRSRTYSKKIKVNTDGTFSDTLKVETGQYNIYDGNESTNMFLKNGFDINMTLNTKQFDESVKFTGIGSEHSSFLAENALLQENMLDLDALAELDEKGLEAKMAGFEKDLMNFYESKTNIDTSLTNPMKKDIKPMLKYYKGFVGQKIALKRDLPKGADSPSFEGYVNYKGGTTSLADLKGKFTYIDVWATWCGPCKAEIPSLKTLEHDYAGKNINFVSLSIDDDRTHKGSWDLAASDWRAMVKDKELGGIQIMAPKGWQSEFIKNYKITGIPRFILVDPNGKIVNADAPRPSSDDIRNLFDSLTI
jgi:thiol-disulfide isomerase/thioredoxin